MKNMIDKLADSNYNWYRSGEGSESKLYDVFDPKYVRLAFEEKKVNLGHLIFGLDKWNSLDEPRSSTQLDPLLDMFSKRGSLIQFLVLTSVLRSSLVRCFCRNHNRLPNAEIQKKMGRNRKKLQKIGPNQFEMV